MGTEPAALEPIHDVAGGEELPLPDALAGFYGALRLLRPPDRPYLFGNFVSSLDGVVSLGEPRTGGDDISGGSREDRALMGLLRAAADVVIVGAGTLRAFPQHLWTPAAIYAPLADAYAELRARLGKPEAPLTVLVTASGALDPSLPVLSSSRAPSMVVTTHEGAQALARAGVRCDIRAVGGGPRLSAREILDAAEVRAGAHVLLECGPRLMAKFFEEGLVDELFLTLAPQVVGRAPHAPREGFVAGALLLPNRPTWGELLSLKRAASLLFLRYRFPIPLAK